MSASGFSHEGMTPRSKRLTTHGQYGASSGTYTLSLGKALIGWVAGLVRGRLLISVNNFRGAQAGPRIFLWDTMMNTAVYPLWQSSNPAVEAKVEAEPLSDLALARAAGQGDMAAFEQLYERHGNVGLLRSAAVAPELQRSGLGCCLTRAVLERAAPNGVEKVVLLTSTARDFFAEKFGFVECDRRFFDEQLKDSKEWNLPRCSTATCMAFDISSGG